MGFNDKTFSSLVEDNKTTAESKISTAYGQVMAGIYTSSAPTLANGDYAFLRTDSHGALVVNASGTTSTGVIVVTATGSSAINTTTSIGAEFRLLKVMVHFSAAPTTSENLVVTCDSNAGAAYDTILDSVDPSSSSVADWVFAPVGETGKFVSGDEIKVTFTNTDTETYGLSIYYELV